jgi:hypothetical protein
VSPSDTVGLWSSAWAIPTHAIDAIEAASQRVMIQ